MYLRIFSFIFSLVFVMCFGACSPDGGTVVSRNVEDLTIAERGMIGSELVEGMKSNPETYDILNGNAYEEVYHYLDELLTTVVVTEQISFRNTEGWVWEIVPMVDEEIFSYTLPGGKLIISTGFLKFLESESELVSLIAHELYYTDKKQLTEPLIEELGGEYIGDIVLGKEVDINDAIELLKGWTFTKNQVMDADMHALELLCPFNYHLNSWKTAVERMQATMAESLWNDHRPRLDEWTINFDQEMSDCTSASGDTFRSRYLEKIALLP